MEIITSSLYRMRLCKWLHVYIGQVFLTLSLTLSLSAEDELQLSALHYSSFRGCPACHYSNRNHSIPEPFPVSAYFGQPATYHHQSGWGQRSGNSRAGWWLTHQHFYWPKLPWLQQQFPAPGRRADIPTTLANRSRLRPEVSQRPGPCSIGQPCWRGCKALSTCRPIENGLWVSEERAKQLGTGP